jgi:M6 family metalloprotease-like protein
MEGNEIKKYSLKVIAVTLVIFLILPTLFLTTSVIANNETTEYTMIVLPVYSNDTGPETSIGNLIDEMALVSEFFDDASYNQLHFEFEIIGWCILLNSMSTYRKETTYPNGVTRITADSLLVSDTISLVSNIVDFQNYDGLIIVHAGESEQRSSDDNSTIGSCFIPDSFSADGKTFNGAAVVSEFDSFITISHELTHWLGAPDLYDYTRKDLSVSIWCIMGSGDYGMCAYTKLAVGFLSDIDVCDFSNGSIRLILSPLSNSHREYRAIRYNLPDGRYYLIEAREQTGVDSGIPSSGVIVSIINQTAIDWKVGGVTLCLPDGSRSLSNATYQVGEVYSNEEDGITLKIVDYTENGFIVDISDKAEFDWVITDRITLPDDTEIRGMNFAYGNYCETHMYFMSLVVEHLGCRYLHLYGSTDEGRTWKRYLNSYGWFNVSLEEGALCYFDQTLMFIGSIEIDNDWCEALVSCNPMNGYSHILNLSTMVNESLYPWLDACSDGTHLYIAIYSINASVHGITQFVLHNYTWSHSWKELTSWSDIGISNCLKDELPVIKFRNETGLYAFEFNSSDIFQVTTNGTWYAQVARADCLYFAFNQVVGNETYFRILGGTFSLGFSEILSKNVTALRKPRICVTDKLVEVIETDMDNMTLYTISEGKLRSSLHSEQRVIRTMPKFDSQERIRTLIGQCTNNIMSTVYWGATTPSEVISIVWFIQTSTDSGYLDVTPILVIGILSITAIVVIVFYTRRRAHSLGSIRHHESISSESLLANGKEIVER